LAGRGVRLTQFYAASSVCSPSRAALLTGRYPHRTGVPGNVESRPERFPGKEGRPDDELTLAEHLGKAGYHTALFGKWHLGNEPGPNDQGFEEAVGFLGGVVDKWSHFNYGGAPWGAAPQRHDWYHNGEEVWAGGKHSGDLIADGAANFMEQHAEEPFFLYLAFGSPHYPLQPHNKWMEHYKHLEQPRRSYAAMVSTIDEQTRRVIDKVEALGLREQTIIVFMSDHGHSVEARNNYGGGNAGPYRGAKGTLFEGGIRVPAIISWPGALPEGAVRGQLATGCDWFSTLSALCNVPLPDHPLDGRDLTAVLNSADAPSPHPWFHWQLNNQWAVRQGHWKLLQNARHFPEPGKKATIQEPLLYNLQADPAEQHNRAEDHPEIVARLSKLHEEWEVRIGAGKLRSR